MSYQVDRFNGTFFVTVADGTVDTTTDLRFVGKNYAGYGEVQNENFLHLLENFANTSAPPKVITGQIWYDSATKKLKFYDGTRFKVAGGAEVSTTAPSNLAEGDFWWDSAAQQLYTYTGSSFVLVGPASSPDLGASSIVSVVVKDSLNVNHSIAKLQSGGDTIAIISKDSFTLNSGVNPITGFSTIKKGINLVNTNSTTGITSTDHYFWGTASNALKLGGFAASDFVRSGSAEFTTQISLNDTGLILGDQNDIAIYVENGDESVFENQLGNTIKLRIRISDSDRREIAIIDPTSLRPGVTDSYTLGTSSFKWNNVYSTTFTGNLVGNVTGTTTGSHKGNVLASDDSVIIDSSAKIVYGTVGSVLNPATVFGNVLGDLNGTANNALAINSKLENTGAVANTIVSRDTSANITANRFIGDADFATRLKIDDGAVDNPSSSYKSAKTSAIPNTIAARTTGGNLVANVFEGTATSSRYADLAEKYITDKEYEVGTVVAVCEHGDHEVEASSWGQRAIGAVSENPAFMMNRDAEGQYIALKGRVPVRVMGAVRKGQRLVAADNGCAVAAVPHANDVFAIALESSDDTGVKLIEAIIL